MLQYLARTVRLLSDHVDGMSFQRTDQRLARCLLSQADGNGVVSLTQEELGATVGASRVTVSRILNDFAHRGYVETGYGSVRVVDPSGLETLA